MEEYNAIEIDAEAESSENEISESFTDTVSGNDAGTDIGMNGQEENQPENNEQTGQDELLESLNALVEVLTPSEEEAETEDGTEPQAEVLPSETETAALPTKKLPKNASNPENSLLICVNVPAKLSTGKLSRPISQ